ncbi:prolyl aminopeptidase [Aliikangiella coralliicola]|uniref:Proline iminopeptidase n=1 Tax=Aliikangiella coralliicola TaxID=2592383 RepID=A0A545U7E2_9GAMM|nr:prolyl aminopeptidase [Aliikangiella coralliicola]TQV85386.1 prolyl aminopeptidase [Aliikangiella coralliicola]
MQKLFPEIKPNQTYRVEVGQGHQIYVEETGTEDGIPIVYLHGGPGAGSDSSHRRFCDPEKYRIILLDQRGCGRSEPHASLENNTIQALIADLEIIRQHLDIPKWVVMGGSWGSTLALAYSQEHPENVLGLILRGVFLGRKQDIDWLYAEGTRKIFPDYWQEFIQPIPKSERSNLLQAFYSRLTGQDELARMAAAKAWGSWEGKSATLEPNPAIVEQFTSPHLALAMARISAHYFVNQCFLEENQLVDNVDKLADIPGIIVHGRYDMICPLENAWTLQSKWNACELHVIRDAGHSAGEAGIIDGLVKATKEMHQLLTHDCTDPTGN